MSGSTIDQFLPELIDSQGQVDSQKVTDTFLSDGVNILEMFSNSLTPPEIRSFLAENVFDSSKQITKVFVTKTTGKPPLMTMNAATKDINYEQTNNEYSPSLSSPQHNRINLFSQLESQEKSFTALKKKTKPVNLNPDCKIISLASEAAKVSTFSPLKKQNNVRSHHHSNQLKLKRYHPILDSNAYNHNLRSYSRNNTLVEKMTHFLPVKSQSINFKPAKVNFLASNSSDSKRKTETASGRYNPNLIDFSEYEKQLDKINLKKMAKQIRNRLAVRKLSEKRKKEKEQIEQQFNQENFRRRELKNQIASLKKDIENYRGILPEHIIREYDNNRL